MKKKILLTILAILVILIALFLINLGRNYLILKKIYDSNTDFTSTLSNSYFEQTTDFFNDLNNYLPTIQTTLYSYNGIYLLKTYDDGISSSTLWYDSNTNESIFFDDNEALQDLYDLNSDGSTSVDELGINLYNTDTLFTGVYSNLLLHNFGDENTVISTILYQNLFTPLIAKNNCYVFKFNELTIYLNKETNLIEKIINDNATISYKVEKNIVTSEDVAKPDSL